MSANDDGGLRNTLYRTATRSGRRMTRARRLLYAIAVPVALALIRAWWWSCRVVRIVGIEHLDAALARALPLDGFFICYHDDAAGCACRKPQPGLILDAAREHGVDLRASFAVGDRWRDIEAAARAGVRSVFVDYGYAERRPHAPDAVVDSFSAAATWIVDAALQPLETGPSSAHLRGGLDP